MLLTNRLASLGLLPCFAAVAAISEALNYDRFLSVSSTAAEFFSSFAAVAATGESLSAKPSIMAAFDKASQLEGFCCPRPALLVPRDFALPAVFSGA